MKSLLSLATTAVLSLAATQAQASGFICNGDIDAHNLHVKLFNHTNAYLGTRVPAAMIVSVDQMGTVLVRKGTEIGKNNNRNTVQYVVEGNRKIDADSVILQITFKEGKEVLEQGEEAPGQLILVKDDEKSVYQLTCERYLVD